MHHFYPPKNRNNSLIRDQKFIKHIANGYKKLVCAVKREAVQFLVAKNLAVNHLPLEALPVVHTWTANVTAKPWSRDILRFAVFHEKPYAKGLHYFSGVCKTRTGYLRMADADGKMRIEKCGWKKKMRIAEKVRRKKREMWMAKKQ